MSQQKKSLQEIASNSDAIKNARAEPIQQVPVPRQSMDFIRSLVLDLPIQTSQVDNNRMNIEKIIEAKVESDVQQLEKTKDTLDYVSFDIPLLIRIFELVREGIKSDEDLHNLVERILLLKNQGVLTMSDYDAVANSETPGNERDTSLSFAKDAQNESLISLKKLAGID